MPSLTALITTGSSLHHKPGQWLGNFLSDILQTALPEFQPQERSIKESESLARTGRETHSQPTAALGGVPFPLQLVSTRLRNGSSHESHRGAVHLQVSPCVLIVRPQSKIKPPAWCQVNGPQEVLLRLVVFFGTST